MGVSECVPACMSIKVFVRMLRFISVCMCSQVLASSEEHENQSEKGKPSFFKLPSLKNSG